MTRPSPGVSILSLKILKPGPRPSEAILLSISRLEDCASVRCASRMQTASVPRSAWQVSTRSSPKKCDLPEPLPPNTPLYRAGASSGSNTRAVGIFRVDNDTLDFLDELESAIVAILQRLHRFAPAAIEDRRRGRNARRGGRVLGLHDADQGIDRRAGVAARDRTDFGEGFGHFLSGALFFERKMRGMIADGGQRSFRARTLSP